MFLLCIRSRRIVHSLYYTYYFNIAIVGIGSSTSRIMCTRSSFISRIRSIRRSRSSRSITSRIRRIIISSVRIIAILFIR